MTFAVRERVICVDPSSDGALEKGHMYVVRVVENDRAGDMVRLDGLKGLYDARRFKPLMTTRCPCGKHSACVPQCALMDYPGYVVEWNTMERRIDAVEDDGFRTAYPEMPYSPPLPDVTRDPAPVTELVDEIDEWYAANDPLMAGAGDGNSPPWLETKLVDRHTGSSLDDFLAEEGILEEVEQAALERILEQRGSRYGAFIDNANVAQGMKNAYRCGEHYTWLKADQKEALDQISAKISRIVTGDPDYVDNWDDIAGYAKLVADRLRETQA